MPRVALEQAYPGIAFRSRTRNWWARLTRVPAECVHLESEPGWMALLAPDTLYLQGHAAARREHVRPEVSLCRACLASVLEPELAAYAGRVVAFEPDAGNFSQYFFLAEPDFDAAGLTRELSEAVAQRLSEALGPCEKCTRQAKWLWLARSEAASLDEVGRIRSARGGRLCPRHGAAMLCASLMAIAEANLFYVNAPYGSSGAYVWI